MPPEEQGVFEGLPVVANRATLPAMHVDSESLESGQKLRVVLDVHVEGITFKFNPKSEEYIRVHHLEATSVVIRKGESKDG